MIGTILVPTDGSEHANKAVDLAADIAEKYAAKLVILHVLLRHTPAPDLLALARRLKAPEALLAQLKDIEDAMLEVSAVAYGYAGPIPVPVPDAALAALGDALGERARQIAEAKGVRDVRVETADGAPADAILYAAEAEGADMIVMGSRGLGRVADLLMGSVSHRVSHLARCTCVTVK